MASASCPVREFAYQRVVRCETCILLIFTTSVYLSTPSDWFTTVAMSEGACNFSRSSARQRGTRMAAVGSQFTARLRLCRTGCRCSVFVSQKVCVVSTINADVRRFDRGRLRPPASVAGRRAVQRPDQMCGDGQTARATDGRSALHHRLRRC